MRHGPSTIGRLAIALLGALLALVVAPGPAAAAVSSCSVSSAGLAFSPYDSQSQAAVDGAGTITVTCTGSGKSNKLSLNLTGGDGGACVGRRMRRGAETLGYQIYRDAARTASFCDGANRLDIAIDFSSGPTQVRTYTMYGRVLAGQNPPPGGYSDALTITLKQGGGTLASTSLTVTGSVAAICTVSAGTLAFGAYAPTAATLGSAAITVNCSSTAPYQVSLGPGGNADASSRRMTGPGGAILSYLLYSDAARTAPWGDGTAFGARVSGTGSGAAQSLPVHGTIPPAQNAPAGAYSDSVLITVEY